MCNLLQQFSQEKKGVSSTVLPPTHYEFVVEGFISQLWQMQRHKKSIYRFPEKKKLDYDPLVKSREYKVSSTE